MCGRVVQVVQRCARQTALERRHLTRTYLAHHELESGSIILSIVMQVEVSSPCEDDLGRIRQITLEKEALAQQRAQAERAKQVSTSSH